MFDFFKLTYKKNILYNTGFLPPQFWEIISDEHGLTPAGTLRDGIPEDVRTLQMERVNVYYRCASFINRNFSLSFFDFMFRQSVDFFKLCRIFIFLFQFHLPTICQFFGLMHNFSLPFSISFVEFFSSSFNLMSRQSVNFSDLCRIFHFLF